MGKTMKAARFVPWTTLMVAAVLVVAYAQPDSWQEFTWKSYQPTLGGYVTYVAAHWDLTHLLGNVAMLLLAGWFVEIAMGRVRFAALVIIATVVSIPVEQLLDWHDGTATNLGGASGLTFALAGACLVGAVRQVVRYRNGEVGDLAYSATGIVVLMSVMSLAGNIASGATEEQGSDLVVAWGSHNLGWVIGVVLALALCPGVIPGAWSATREALSDARFNRASRARVRALQRAL